MSPQNHVDNGNQLKGSLPFSNINVFFILDELKIQIAYMLSVIRTVFPFFFMNLLFLCVEILIFII